MRLPVLEGVIRRRLLVNFRVAPDVLQAQLPQPFRPKLQGGYGIAGICLIRLEAIRPRRVPAVLGLSSENAAHRIAVIWDGQDGKPQEGVFIPRRDTGSLLNQLTGGRVFPGEHHRARFDVQETDDKVSLSMASSDGHVAVRVRASYGGTLPSSSCFGSLSEASSFFEPGSLGYSVTKNGRRLDGLTLRTTEWRVEPLEVDDVYSSYFSDPARFPPGSATFDCGLAMRNVVHEWHTAADLYVPEGR